MLSSRNSYLTKCSPQPCNESAEENRSEGECWVFVVTYVYHKTRNVPSGGNNRLAIAISWFKVVLHNYLQLLFTWR